MAVDRASTLLLALLPALLAAAAAAVGAPDTSANTTTPTPNNTVISVGIELLSPAAGTIFRTQQYIEFSARVALPQGAVDWAARNVTVTLMGNGYELYSAPLNITSSVWMCRAFVAAAGELLLYGHVHLIDDAGQLVKVAETPVTSVTAVDVSTMCKGWSCWLPCPSPQFKVYVYKDANRTVAGGMSPQYAAILAAVEASVWNTNDPLEACLFVPDVDTLRVHNRYLVSPLELQDRLVALKWWRKSGANHLVFHVADHEVDFNAGVAAMIKSSPTDSFVEGHDCVFPLAFYRCGFPEYAHLARFPLICQDGQPPAEALPAAAYSARPVLLSFKGARYDPAQALNHTRGRDLVRKLHNGDDIQIITFCRWRAYECLTHEEREFFGATDADCAAENALANRVDFEQLLLNSQFSLVLGGEGAHSYRLIEVLAAGAIPVIVGPRVVKALPFSGMMDWSLFAVLVPDDDEASIAQLPALLAAISPERRARMAQLGTCVFTAHFRTLDRMLATTISELERRWFDAPRPHISKLLALQADAADPVAHLVHAMANTYGVTSDWVSLIEAGTQVFAASMHNLTALLTYDVAALCNNLGVAFMSLNMWQESRSSMQWFLVTGAFDYSRWGNAIFRTLHPDFTWDLGVYHLALATVQHQQSPQWPAGGQWMVPAAGYTRPSIAVVSLCEYDAADTPLTALSATIKTAYTRRHGYRLFFETKNRMTSRAPAWGKVTAVLKYLDAADWVVWMDCDTFIMNHTIPLEWLIHTGTVNATNPSQIDLIISEDGTMLNSGLFAIRSTPWSRYMLTGLLHSRYDAFGTHPWWEQAALFHWLAKTPGVGPWAGLHNHPKLALVPQRLVNSYPPELSGTLFNPETRAPLHATYRPGDFVAAFSGCKASLTPQACNDLFERYFAQSMGWPLGSAPST